MRKSEFRFNRRRKHPAYVYKEVNGKYYSILITHAKQTRNKKNIELHQNPNPKDSSKAYLIKSVVSDKTSSYDKPKRGWFFNRNDKRKVKRIKKANRRVD